MLKLLPILILFSTLVLMDLASPLDSTAITLTAAPTPTPTIEPETRCSCPEIVLDASLTQVRDGDNIEFAAELSDENIAIPKYFWTVENGTIIKGQGTNEITVRAEQTKDSKSVKASVEFPVYSSLCVCPTTKSISVEFGKHSGYHDFNIPAYVDRIDVDEERLTLRCSSGNLPGKETKESEDLIIKIQTLGVDQENDPLVYNYTVTGGRIVGTGANVEWDMTNALPGTYTITAGVDDGCGICGKTASKSITVVECASSQPTSPK